MSTYKTEEIFSFGKRFREERERLGITQSKLGEALSTTGRTVAKYESGETEPKLSQLLIFSKLGADAGYILTGSRIGVAGTVAESLAGYARGDVDNLIDVFAHTDELGREALLSVAKALNKKGST